MPTHITAQHRLFNGLLSDRRLNHADGSTDYRVFLPPQAVRGYNVPFICLLADSTAAPAAGYGAERFAAQWGIALLSWNMADIAPADAHRHLAEILPQLCGGLPLYGRPGLIGFNRAGGTALLAALLHPDSYNAVSAFAPQFPADSAWQQHGFKTAGKSAVLIDSPAPELNAPDTAAIHGFITAARAAGIGVQHRLRPGYDNSPCFAASFIDSHIEFHADAFEL